MNEGENAQNAREEAADENDVAAPVDGVPNNEGGEENVGPLDANANANGPEEGAAAREENNQNQNQNQEDGNAAVEHYEFALNRADGEIAQEDPEVQGPYDNPPAAAFL